MPYITKKARSCLALGETAKCAGELNYLLTLMVHRYFKENGTNYQAINDVVGALEGCKAEFQRRVVAKYEDEKRAINGDVP